ncbi:MAG: molybdate transport system ATP-binding protein [Janthinobacterium sp.]|jgi:molybdate transport system ATP-binding protein
MQLELDLDTTLHSGKRSFRLRLQFASTSRRIVIYGPSGAGKSLTLKAIAGLLTPAAGRVTLAGRTLFDTTKNINLTPQQRNVAYLFQDYALFPHLTVRQNVGFGLARGWLNPRPAATHEAVDHWLGQLGLAHLAQQYPDQLSGGQRQRTALARALAAQPGALLLDEPFAALDPALRVKLRSELDQLQRQLALPMILITHDPEDVRLFGDDVLYLRDGAIARDKNAAGEDE